MCTPPVRFTWERIPRVLGLSEFRTLGNRTQDGPLTGRFDNVLGPWQCRLCISCLPQGRCRELRYYLISSYLSDLIFFFILSHLLYCSPHCSLPRCHTPLVSTQRTALYCCTYCSLHSCIILSSFALPRTASLIVFHCFTLPSCFLSCFHSRSPYCSLTYINLHTLACILHSDLLVNSPLVSCS